MYTISGHARASAAIVVWKFGRRIWRARDGGGRADGRSVGAAARRRGVRVANAPASSRRSALRRATRGAPSKARNARDSSVSVSANGGTGTLTTA